MPRRKLPPPPGEPPRESRHAGQQPKEVTDKVKELLDEGFEPGPISKRLNIGRSAVYRMTTNIALYGTPYAPKNDKPNGRPKLLTYEQEVVRRHDTHRFNVLTEVIGSGRVGESKPFRVSGRHGMVHPQQV